MFPFFIPFNSGGGGGEPPSWRGFVALFIAMPLYAFLIGAIIHFADINVDKIMFAWYGPAALLGTFLAYAGAVFLTAIAFD